MSLDDLVSIIKNKLDIKGLRVAKGSDKVNTIAVINGSGQDYFYEAKKLKKNFKTPVSYTHLTLPTILLV